MELIVILVYVISLLFVFLFSLGQLHLTWHYIRSKKQEKEESKIESRLPPVTIQLPVFNELYVIERLIR